MTKNLAHAWRVGRYVVYLLATQPAITELLKGQSPLTVQTIVGAVSAAIIALDVHAEGSKNSTPVASKDSGPAAGDVPTPAPSANTPAPNSNAG